MEEVARYYGFGLYVQNISQESLDATAGSLFSGCLRDIEYGFVDLCIGGFHCFCLRISHELVLYSSS